MYYKMCQKTKFVSRVGVVAVFSLEFNLTKKLKDFFNGKHLIIIVGVHHLTVLSLRTKDGAKIQ